jgi:hypothetical protein
MLRATATVAVGVTAWHAVGPGALAASGTGLTTPARLVAGGSLTPLSGLNVRGARVVVSDAGNSILYDAEPALAAALLASGQAELRPHTIGGFGISEAPDVWQNVFTRDVVDGDDARLVLVMLGNRDFPVVKHDPRRYQRLLDESVHRLTARGAGVIWLGLPPLPAWQDDPGARIALNTMLAGLPERFPGKVRYVPTEPALASASGGYARSLPGPDGRPVAVRKRRGTRGDEHLCPAGAVRLTQLVQRELARVGLRSASAASWSTGAWTADARYDDPKGGCL